MAIRIEEVTQFKTLDGQVHSTLQLATAHAGFLTLSASMDKDIYWHDTGPEEVVAWISNHKQFVREFLDLLDSANLPGEEVA